MTEQDLDDWLIWCGYAPQSREAVRPQLSRGVRWLREMGVTRLPFGLPWYSFEAARSSDLLSLWELHARPVRDKKAEHELRNLLAQLGAGVRPYKP
jgi:hypothetical protein